ncbi:MAG: hypothetical protein WCK17_08795 [Verrucomicrobiota bacterium]|jgi:hypothetical protein
MKRQFHPPASAVGHQTTAPVQPGLEWLRPGDVRPRYGIGRSLLYELLKEGKIKSVCLRREGRATGIRLVSAISIEAYISSHEEAGK